jgi:hypothetical protein
VSTWLINCTDDEWLVYELADGFHRGKILTALQLAEQPLHEHVPLVASPGHLGLDGSETASKLAAGSTG